MRYDTREPVVVGQFDADFINSEIDAVQEFYEPLGWSYDIVKELAARQGISAEEVGSIKSLAHIKWNRPKISIRFDLYDSDMGGERIEPVATNTDPGKRSIDQWHVDTMGGSQLLEIVTGASRRPTEFIVGRFAVEPSALLASQAPNAYFRSEHCTNMIESALEEGDARVVTFEPGKVVHVPAGTLHRRPAPETDTGARFFFRHFAHSPAKIGAVRRRLRQ